ncbi:YfjI family protein [Noviherbaspirillum sp. 1P10PC]|uniref:YfjI family protein n=1 Tax=Noviherbaspirillum sp. 1P10PC TaxID=3132292 RepID=UPI0039A07B86
MHNLNVAENSDFQCDARFAPSDAEEIFRSSLSAISDSVSTKPEHLSVRPEGEASLGWSTPQAIVAELQPVVPLSVALLPRRLADFVFDEASRMPCSPDYIAAALITALGSIIGARTAVKPKALDDGWLVVPNLWGGIVGEPSTKKTPAISVAMNDLDRLEAVEAVKLANKLAAYTAEKAAHDAYKKAIEKDMKDAIAADGDAHENNNRLATAKRNLAALQAPVEPYQRRFKCNDATTEKLGDLLTTNPAGLLVLRDELTGLLSSWDKTGHEGDRAFYLESWNGSNSFHIDRIGRGSKYVQNLCLSVFGGIQPDLLTQYLGGIVNSLDNDGRIQRFQVLVYPDPVPWAWHDRTPAKESRAAMRAIFDHLASFDPVMDGATRANDHVKLPYFSFDDAAQKVFIAWSEDLYHRIVRETNPLMRQHLAKYEKLFCSLALIFHLVEGHVGHIKEDIALQAAAYCAYLESHARRIYAMTEAATMTAAQVLSRRLAEGKLDNGFTARDVHRKGWGSLAAPKQVESALSLLEEAGWVKPIQHQGDTGRPTVIYLINPQVQSKKEGSRS